MPLSILSYHVGVVKIICILNRAFVSGVALCWNVYLRLGYDIFGLRSHCFRMVPSTLDSCTCLWRKLWYVEYKL